MCAARSASTACRWPEASPTSGTINPKRPSGRFQLQRQGDYNLKGMLFFPCVREKSRYGCGRFTPPILHFLSMFSQILSYNRKGTGGLMPSVFFLSLHPYPPFLPYLLTRQAQYIASPCTCFQSNLRNRVVFYVIYVILFFIVMLCNDAVF